MIFCLLKHYLHEQACNHRLGGEYISFLLVTVACERCAPPALGSCLTASLSVTYDFLLWFYLAPLRVSGLTHLPAAKPASKTLLVPQNQVWTTQFSSRRVT